MRNSRCQRQKYPPTVRSPQERTSIFGPSLEHPHHLQVVRVGRVIVICNLVILLRRLENQRNLVAATILHQPLEGLFPYEPVPYENVTILVGAELARAVIEVEERRRVADGFLEFIQDRREGIPRWSEVVARGEKVAGVQSIARSTSESLR